MKKFDLKKWREKHGLNILQLSEIILLSHDTIQRIEAGTFKGNMLLVESFCELYDKKKAIK
jgi:DNA-binding XRE family transcriptional regulator